MKHFYKYLLLYAMILYGVTGYAQVFINENFDTHADFPQGWNSPTLPGFTITPNSACEGNSIRGPLNPNSTNPELIYIGQISTGEDIEISFDYKILENITNNPATNEDFGEFILQYSIDNGLNWISYYTINQTSHIPSINCVTLAHTISSADIPADSEFAWRIKGSHNQGSNYIYIDNFSAIEQVDCIQPFAIKIEDVTSSSIEISWSDLNNIQGIEWEVAFCLEGADPSNPSCFLSNIITVNSNPYTITGLPDGTKYDIFVRAKCSTTNNSRWSNFVTVQTIPLGTDCNLPMEISSLPFSHSDNTAKYGNNYSGLPGIGCVGSDFLLGYDLVYKYTPTTDDYLNVKLSNLNGANRIGLFVYEDCSDIGDNCYAGETTISGSDFDFDIHVTANQSYYFLLSARGQNAAIDFTLDITGFDCPSFDIPNGQTSYDFLNQKLSDFDNTSIGVLPTNDLAYLTWYEDNNGTPGAPILNTGMVTLSNGDVYHVNQTLGVCESSYLKVTFAEFDCTGRLEILSTDTGGHICGEGSIMLSATAATDNINWYEQEHGGRSVGRGSDFQTDIVSQTTSYWVSEAFMGEGIVNGQGIAGPSALRPYSASGHGLLISNVSRDFTLVSVQVYSTASIAGPAVIELADLSGVYGTQSVSVHIPRGTTSAPTLVTIPLNFELKTGAMYSLVKSSGPSMIYTPSASFPYSIGDVAEITSGVGIGSATAGSDYFYFYNWNIIQEIILCESERTEVIAEVKDVAGIVPTANETTVCIGQTATLEVSSTDFDYAYTWEWIDETGTRQILTGSQIEPVINQTTTFSVSGYNSIIDCSSTVEQITVSAIGVNEVPVNSKEIESCVGEVVKLVAGDIIYDFESSNTGWTTLNNSTGPNNPSGAGWKLVNSPHYSTGRTTSNDNSQFYISNADEVGPTGRVETYLTSPSINLAGVEESDLSFYHHYNQINTQSTIGAVQISVSNGSWIDLKRFGGTVGSSEEFAKEIISLANYVGYSNVRIRFQYTGSWGWWWAVDNVKLSNTYTNGVFSWTSHNDLFLDEDASIPYDGESIREVYFKSDAPGIFNYNIGLDIISCGSLVANQIKIDVKETMAPIGPTSQTYVNGQTLGDLDVVGQNLRYYIVENQEYIEQSPNVLLRHGTTYYITQNLNDCESEFLEVTVSLHCPAPTDILVDTEVGVDGDTASIVVTWTPPSDSVSIQNYFLEIKDSLENVVYQGTSPVTSNYLVIHGLRLKEDFVLETYSICDSNIPVYSPLETTTFSTHGLSSEEYIFADFIYFPNPTDGMITFSNAFPMESIEVFSINGKKILKIDNINDNEVTINLRDMASGVYFSVITIGSSVEVVRIIRK